MKGIQAFRSAALLLIAALLCSGCEKPDLGAEARDVSGVEFVRTLGFDLNGSETELTVCTGMGRTGDGPAMYRTAAQSAAEAMRKIEDGYTREKLFFSHTDHMILGESAARENVDGYLDFIARMMQMRTDTNIFIVKDVSAKELISETVDGASAASDVLSAIKRELKNTGEGYVFTCGDVLSSLLVRDCAVAQAVALGDSEELSPDGSLPGIRPAGYALIREGALSKFLDEDETRAVTVLMRKPTCGLETVSDGAGGRITLSVSDYKVKYRGIFENGAVSGARIDVSVSASVEQIDGSADITDEEVRRRVADNLAEKEYTSLRKALDSSQREGVDYMDIGGKLTMKEGGKVDLERWTRIFPDSVLELTVTASIKRTFDMLGPAGG